MWIKINFEPSKQICNLPSKKKGSEKRHITENQYASPSVCWILGENYSGNPSPSRLRILWTASGWSCTAEQQSWETAALLWQSSYSCCRPAHPSKGASESESTAQAHHPQDTAAASASPAASAFISHSEGLWALRALSHTSATTRWHTPDISTDHTRVVWGHRNRAQEFHHLPWTDLQTSTPETCSFHLYPTAEGHQFVPTDFPHKLT